MFHSLLLLLMTNKYREKNMMNVDIGSSSIPHDIILEIFIRVPVKSLMRFKCLSRSFCSFISEPLFIEAHQRSHMPQFLLDSLSLHTNAFIYNLGYKEEHHQNLACPISYLNQPCFHGFDCITQSISGLLCLWNNTGKVSICNPFTKQHVFLPHEHHKRFHVGSNFTVQSITMY